MYGSSRIGVRYAIQIKLCPDVFDFLFVAIDECGQIAFDTLADNLCYRDIKPFSYQGYAGAIMSLVKVEDSLLSRLGESSKPVLLPLLKDSSVVIR